MLGNIGFSELIVILIIVLVLFGGKKIPEVARGLGTGIREFRDAARSAEKEIMAEHPTTASSTPAPIAHTTTSNEPIAPK